MKNEKNEEKKNRRKNDRACFPVHIHTRNELSFLDLTKEKVTNVSFALNQELMAPDVTESVQNMIDL